MPRMTAITLKLNDQQLRQLERLTKKLGIERANVIRLAIARLVAEEAHRRPDRTYAERI